MNIRELQLFRHLATTLHFGRTSQLCNITPSGLTRTMQRLEGELGKPLFDRNNRSVKLTPAGLIFKDYAEETIQRWTELKSRLEGDDVLRGNLSLYCSVTAILSILPCIFSHFRTVHPEVSIHLETGDAARSLFKVQSGEADISIAALPDRKPAGLDFFELIQTPLIFIAPAHHSTSVVYRDGSIDWTRTPVIMAEQGLSRERVNRWFADKDILPNIYSQVAGNEAIIAMVGMGCGIGVVPFLVLEKSLLKDQVQLLDVRPQLRPFSVGLCTAARNRLSPTVAAFWDIATSEAETIGRTSPRAMTTG